MKKYDLCKLATQKVLSEEYCVLSIKVANCDGEHEISAIGIVDKKENVVFDMSFEPKRKSESERDGVVYFKNEFNNLLMVMSRYEYIIVFNETAIRKLFVRTAEKYGLSTRLLDRIFKKFFCAQTLYDAYIGFVGTKLEIACKVEHIDDSDTKDAISVSYILQEFIKTIANEYTYPNPNEYTALVAKTNPNTNKETATTRKKKETAKPKKPYVNYVELFKSGKSIDEIAKAANVKVQTVESHILNAYEQGKITNIDTLIQPDYVQSVLSIVNADGWDGKLRSVKEALPDDCTYISIRATIAKSKKNGIAETANENRGEIESKKKDDVSNEHVVDDIPDAAADNNATSTN